MSSKAAGKVTDRKTLARWFWQERGMDYFRNGQHRVYIKHLPPLTWKDFSELSELAFGDAPLREDCYEYDLAVFTLGYEQFGAVLCDGRLVIGPFPFTGTENLPRTEREVWNV